MNFIEVMMLIGERGEKIIQDKIHTIQTDKHMYARDFSTGSWQEKELPPPPEDRLQPITPTKK
jgi:hypothetical protein